MGLRGDLSSLKRMKQTLKALPRTVAADVAKRAAPALTDLTQEAFTSGRNVYGDARPASTVDGRALTLERTGATKAQMRFVQVGTVVRCVLGPKYARYLIGKYGILPNGALPARWSFKLGEIVKTTKDPDAL
jgi:hypothetical protein